MSEIFIYDLTDTWNNSGNVFDAIKMNVTNTASASGSKLLNLQVGGVERFTVDVDGTATATTPTSGDNSTKLATTAFVQDAFSSFQFDISNVTATWNDAGTLFTGIGLDVTDTASDANSNLMDLKVGGTSKFSVSKTGTLTLNVDSLYVNENYVYTGTSPGTLTHRVYTARGTQTAPEVSLAGDRLIGFAAFPRLSSGFSGGPGARMQFIYRGDASANTRATDIEFETSVGTAQIWPRLGIVNDGGIWIQVDNYDSNTANRVHLHSDAANNLALRNGTDSHSLNIYNTYTDSSNYERAFIRTTNDVENTPILELGVEGSGTGIDGIVSFPQKVRFPYNVNTADVAIGFNSDPSVFATDWGFGSSGVGIVNFTTSNAPRISFSISGINMYQGRSLTFGETLSSSDIGITRESAGVLKVTDGSTGTGTLETGLIRVSGNNYSDIQTSDQQNLNSGIKFTNYGLRVTGNSYTRLSTNHVAENAGVDFNTKIGFAPGTANADLVADTAIERESAGVLKVTDNSTGYGKIIADGYQLNNPINSQTGTTYTAAVADAERYVQLDNAAAITVTVPSDTTANLPIGSTVTFEQTGAGTVTFAADSGVTINSRGAVLSTAGQFAVATIIKTASNTFTLTGDLV